MKRSQADSRSYRDGKYRGEMKISTANKRRSNRHGRQRLFVKALQREMKRWRRGIRGLGKGYLTRAELIEMHDALCEAYVNNDDPQRERSLYEQIAFLEILICYRCEGDYSAP